MNDDLNADDLALMRLGLSRLSDAEREATVEQAFRLLRACSESPTALDYRKSRCKAFTDGLIAIGRALTDHREGLKESDW